MDHAKGDIDPGSGRLCRLGDTMFPIMLGFALHEEVAAVREVDGDQSTLILITPQLKAPGSAKTNRSYGGITAEFLFIVPVPAHAVVTIPVQIQQGAGEEDPGGALCYFFYCQQDIRPRTGLEGDPGITICSTRIAIPGGKTGLEHRIAEYFNRLLLPGDFPK